MSSVKCINFHLENGFCTNRREVDGELGGKRGVMTKSYDAQLNKYTNMRYEYKKTGRLEAGLPLERGDEEDDFNVPQMRQPLMIRPANRYVRA